MIDSSQELMKATLAASTNFRTLVGAADSAAALLRIHGDELPKPAVGPTHTETELTALRPCAVIFIPSDHGWQIERDASGDAASGSDCWNPSGILHVLIYRNVPVADKNDHTKVDKDFRVIAGDIISDLVGLSETAGMLAIRKISVFGPFRTKHGEMKAIGDAQVYELMIEWGHR